MKEEIIFRIVLSEYNNVSEMIKYPVPVHRKGVFLFQETQKI